MIDAAASADAGEVLAGEMAVAACDRIVAEHGAQPGTVAYALEFGRDDEGRRYVRGTLKADVQVACSRCLAPLLLPIETQLILAIVADEAAAALLPEQYDPLVANGPVPLSQVVEDEVLLALPLAPVHPESVCGAGELAADSAEVPRGPFAVLAGLRPGGRQGD